MKFKYQLPETWIKRVVKLEEFASGATQVSIELKDGRVFKKVLISNSMHIVAARGLKDLPFEIAEIRNIFQFAEDKHPPQRDGWELWDTGTIKLPRS